MFSHDHVGVFGVTITVLEMNKALKLKKMAVRL